MPWVKPLPSGLPQTSVHQAVPRLLAGPPLDGRPEPLHAHEARLGPLPRGAEAAGIIPTLEASGLLGRGGAGFPVGRKWRALAERAGGPAVVVANGAEGEQLSWKDRVLMAHRPHLVIDGAVLAAEAIRAEEIVFYVGGEHEQAVAAIRGAFAERGNDPAPALRLVTAPVGYVAGEATAAVHCIDTGDARPTTTPPRVSQQGVGGRPTLVQNVESLAHAALIARFGERWFRFAGRLESPGTALVTVSGAVREPGVREIELGTTVAEVAAIAGAETDIESVLLGGYFGTWARAEEAWGLALDPAALRAAGLTFGCGIVGFLSGGSCGVSTTAQIMEYMAAASARQCGPCAFGLRAIADAVTRIAGRTSRPRDLDDVERWMSMVAGRGACHHPDGVVQLLASALTVFGREFDRHAHGGRCSAAGSRLDVA